MNEIDEIARLRGDAEIARLRLAAARGEVEKLQHRVRFQDSVIRSGDVAALTDKEREALLTVRDIYASHDDDDSCADIASAIDGLLARLK